MMGGSPSGRAVWRIGELSKRVGVAAATLRAWEDRYALLQPERSEGNYRLYSPDDEARVRRALAHMQEGVSAAEAARLALGELQEPPVERGQLEALEAELLNAFESFDEAAAEQVLDRLFALVTIERALRDVVLPTLHEIGERWERNELTVAQEHYATNLIHARLQALAGGWQTGPGPAAVLACLPGELHALGLICLSLGLRNRGWAVLYLGQDTPLSAIEQTALRVDARLVVLAAAMPERLVELTDGSLRLPDGAQLAVGGPGARGAAAGRLGALLLDMDPLTAADHLTRELR